MRPRPARTRWCCRPSTSWRRRRSRRRDRRCAISVRGVAEGIAGHANLQRYDAYREPGPLGAGRHRRQRLRQRVRARPLLSWFRRDRGNRDAARARRLSEWRPHQRGVRRSVNWDLIPANAIDKTTIIAANPIFGLNALGGAVIVTMKNGFTWQGFEADARAARSIARKRKFSTASRSATGRSIWQAHKSTTAAGASTRPRNSPTSTATSATRRTGLSRTCNSRRGTPSSASLPTRRSSCCRRIGAASTPFPRRPITRWPCSNGTAATPIRPR